MNTDLTIETSQGEPGVNGTHGTVTAIEIESDYGQIVTLTEGIVSADQADPNHGATVRFGQITPMYRVDETSVWMPVHCFSAVPSDTIETVWSAAAFARDEALIGA